MSVVIISSKYLRQLTKFGKAAQNIGIPVEFGSPHQLKYKKKKNVVIVGPALTKPSGSAHVQYTGTKTLLNVST